MNTLRCYFGSLFVLSVILFSTGCSSDEEFGLEEENSQVAPLQISVSTTQDPTTKGVITDSKLSDGSSIGVFITKTADGSDYDNVYKNVEFVSSSSGSQQIWEPMSPVMLTATHASVYAYYPYSSSATLVNSVLVDATKNIDYLRATPVTNVYSLSPTATLRMNHVLTLIRLNITKGDYTGAGVIQSVSLKSSVLTTKGYMNLTSNYLSFNGGSEITCSEAGSLSALSDEIQSIEQLAVPYSSKADKLTIKIKMDGSMFTLTTPNDILFEQAKSYTFGLSFTDSKLELSSVTVASRSSLSCGTVEPFAFNPKTWADAKEVDGVYGIKDDGKPLTYEVASAASSLSGVAIVMYGRALQISNRNDLIQWGERYDDIDGIPNLTVVGGGSSDRNGYLAGTSTPQLSRDHTIWPNTPNTALADTCGWKNTEALIKEQTYNSSHLGPMTKKFRENSSVNQGYSDWFVPAAGQLAYINLKVTEINTLLQKVTGAFQIHSDQYWSSSESNLGSAWFVDFSKGYVDCSNPINSLYVRFCREL